MSMIKASGYEQQMLHNLGHHRYAHVYVSDDDAEVVDFMMENGKAPHLVGLLVCHGWQVRTEPSNIWPRGTPSWNSETAAKLINREKALAG